MIASRTASTPYPASAGPFFARGASPCPTSRGRCNSIAKRVVRSTSVLIAELPRPRIRSPSQCPGTRSIGSFGRALTDHNIRRDKALAWPAYAPPGHAQHAPYSQAGPQLAAQHSPALNEESLIDGFVADAHRLVIREVDRQASGNLLRAPGFGPSSILAPAMLAALPRNGGTRNGSAARGCDNAGKSLLHISAQGYVERKVARFGPPGGSIRIPLGSCCPILTAGDLRALRRETSRNGRAYSGSTPGDQSGSSGKSHCCRVIPRFRPPMVALDWRTEGYAIPTQASWTLPRSS